MEREGIINSRNRHKGTHKGKETMDLYKWNAKETQKRKAKRQN